MRKLNETEQQILSTLKERHKAPRNLSRDVKVRYDVRGNTVLALVQAKTKNYIGVAKYNPQDQKLGLPFNEEIGQRLAFRRALVGE